MSSSNPPARLPDRRGDLNTSSAIPADVMAKVSSAPHALHPPSTLSGPDPRLPANLPNLTALRIPKPPVLQSKYGSAQNKPHSNTSPQQHAQRASEQLRTSWQDPAHSQFQTYPVAGHPAPYVPYAPQSSYQSGSGFAQQMQRPPAGATSYDYSPLQDPYHRARDLPQNSEDLYGTSPCQSTSHPSNRGSIGSHSSSATTSTSYSALPRQSTNLAQAMGAPRQTEDITNRYQLEVRQQPVAARACGFGERDRRVIDPPPIIQLSLADFNPDSAQDIKELKHPFHVVHCSLLLVPAGSARQDWTDEVTQVSDPNNSNRISRRLMGTLVASPFVGVDPDALPARNENARLGCFFVFPDLSCRQSGLYRLRFTYMKINVELMPTGSTSPLVSTVESSTFEVFSAKDFPGMRPSTNLTKALKQQGAHISVKKGSDSKTDKKNASRQDSSAESASGGSEHGTSMGKQHKRKR